MESDLWRGFAEVAHTGSFTKAAERLPISQSGLSQQVRRLESLLQVTLLERTPRKVELTDVGARLLPLVLELIAAEDAVLDAARSEGQTEEPEVMDIVVAEDATGDLLINLIDQLRSTAPNVRVQVTQVSIGNQTAALLNAGSRAAMIERTPTPQPVGPGRRTPLRSEPLCVVMPDGSSHPSQLTVAQAAELNLRPMTWLPDTWLDWFPLLRGTFEFDDDSSVLVVSSFRSAVQSVPLDRHACVAPLSIAESINGVGATLVPLIDGPLASLDLVSLSNDPLLDLLHAVAATIGASNSISSEPTTSERR